MAEQSFFEKYFTSQKQKWIIIEGVVVLVCVVLIVAYSLFRLHSLREDEKVYQEYGDRAMRVSYEQ